MAMIRDFMGRGHKVNMRRMRTQRLLALLLAVAAMAALLFIARPYLHGLSFVVRAAEMQGRWRRAADFDTTTITEREITIPTPRGSLRARVYTPKRSRRTALLTSGLHPSGIDEPRLVRLARELSASGVTIVTPDIPELSHFVISPAITDTIGDAALWLAGDSGLAPDRHVAMLGISFSGGLSVVAAGRSAVRDRVSYVLSFGGHDDLPRVLRYLCTGSEPLPTDQLRLNGSQSAEVLTRPPHDYGVAVMLYGMAERVVPRAQVEGLRAAVQRYLLASALDTVDKSRAEIAFAELREASMKMPEPSRTLMRYVNDRDVVHLGPHLLPYVAQFGGDPALSPSRSPKPAAPVFLLHGTDDNVIPSVESEYLANDLRGHAPVRLLLSGLISHAEADRPAHIGDVLQLASFWGDLLSR
jgi:acetyl esterase/lipase